MSDKCPASVDTLSSLQELISSLDFDWKAYHAVRCGNLKISRLHLV